MTGPLNLSDADLSGFEPIDAGQYQAEVVKVSWVAVTSDSGKLPKGTPMLKVEMKVLNPRINGEEIQREPHVWSQMANPPEGYDAKKSAMMRGMIVKFFTALGYDEADVMGGEFDPDFDDLTERRCTVTVGKEPKKSRDGNIVEGEYNNPIKAFKPAGELAESAASGTSGLL